MPGYQWLFRGSPDQPTSDAMDLVAYLNTLGRAARKVSPDPRPDPVQPAYSVAPSVDPADADAGKAVFAANCAGCHGTDGSGRSPGGRALRPVAFDLTGFRLPPGTVLRALANGVPGTSMPAWHDLPPSEFDSVLHYVLSLPKTPNLALQNQWAPTPALMLAGKRVFDTHCTRCHGEAGDGNGPDAARNARPPANFHQIEVSFQGAAYVIRNGVPGSGMPAWPLMTPAETQAVTVYMRSLYQDSATAHADPESASALQEEKSR
jgi:mono/diheme cytochrome c family protein